MQKELGLTVIQSTGGHCTTVLEFFGTIDIGVRADYKMLGKNDQMTILIRILDIFLNWFNNRLNFNK